MDQERTLEWFNNLKTKTELRSALESMLIRDSGSKQQVEYLRRENDQLHAELNKKKKMIALLRNTVRATSQSISSLMELGE